MKLPNILYVFADQWPAHALGFHGDPNVRTPCLDAFSKEAVNCRHAIANTPVCTPCRATLLTGLLPDRHGLFLNDAPLDPHAYTLGEFFSSLGYATGYVGKWHVDGNGRANPIPPERRHGFEYWKVLECTHDYNHSSYFQHGDTERRVWEGYDAIAQTDDVARYIKDRDRSRPFAMILSWGPPHNPYHTAPLEYQSLYDPAALKLRPNVPEDYEPARRDIAGFYAHCTALDACMGRLLQTLEDEGIAEETLVVFASDHGDHLGSFGLNGKQTPLEESLRIPFLIRWPQKLSPHGNDSVITVLDVFPTLCGLLGVDQPPGLQGRDLSRELQEQRTPDEIDNHGFCASYHNFGPWPFYSQEKGVPPWLTAREYRGIRTSRFTYCRDLNGPWLLFDNVEDPYQLRNLVDDPGHADLQRELDGRLGALLEHYGDRFEPGMEYVRRWGYQVDPGGTLRPLPSEGEDDWSNMTPPAGKK